MGKGHRDNTNARKKRGQEAFDKKAKRREQKRIACNLCGTKARPEKLDGGLCPPCLEHGSSQEKVRPYV